MKNRIKELRKSRDWSQQELADAMCHALERHPDLLKRTKKNPSGIIDQRTVQKLEAGEIRLSGRYILLLQEVFSMTPNDILGLTSDDEIKLLEFYRRASESKKAALLNLLSENSRPPDKP